MRLESLLHMVPVLWMAILVVPIVMMSILLVHMGVMAVIAMILASGSVVAPPAASAGIVGGGHLSQDVFFVARILCELSSASEGESGFRQRT